MLPQSVLIHTSAMLSTFPCGGVVTGLTEPFKHEGDIGVCSVGQFFWQYFGNFNLKLWYCGIQTNLRDAVFY